MAQPAATKDAILQCARKALCARMKIGIALAFVVAAQCVLAWLLLPPAASTEAPQTKYEAKPHAEGSLEQPIDDHHSERREVDLGRFSVTSIEPATNTTLLIDFHLYGAVRVDPPNQLTTAEQSRDGYEKQKDDADSEDTSRFGRLLKMHNHRFRDQVIVVMRNARMSDLSDPALALIKREILAKTNSLLGEPLLKEVIISDFAIAQQ